MSRHHEPFALGALRAGTIASAILLTLGISGCDTGGDVRDGAQPLGQAAQPERELDEPAADIDIGARSTEEGTAARNEAAARTDSSQADDADSAIGSDAGASDEPGSTELAAAGATGAASAAAVLTPTEGKQASGNASFIEMEDGLQVVVTMAGLEPGQHGIHVHENGDCSGPAAEAAGDHFNPQDVEHGAPSDDPAQRHAGDLGNISADASGEAELSIVAEGMTVQGERGVAGKAIIVHADEDDLSSQPSGESGDPVACGVIEVSARG